MTIKVISPSEASPLVRASALEQGCFLSGDSSGFYYGAFENESLVGIVCLKGLGFLKAEVKHLYVKKEYRGKKIASMLLQKVVEDAPGFGWKVLFATVREGNKPSRAVFEKHGFVQVGKTTSPATGATLLVYVKVIG